MNLLPAQRELFSEVYVATTPAPQDTDEDGLVPNPVLTVYNNAIFAVATAQAFFSWKSSDGATPEDDRPALASAADVAAQELQLLSAQKEAYARGSPQANVQPPSQSLIDDSTQLLGKLQALNLTVAAEADVFDLVTQILAGIGKL